MLTKKTEEEKAQDEAAKARDREQQARATEEYLAAARAEADRVSAFQAMLPRWEYQVKRVGEDKQKGLLGSQRMEQIFNGEGAKGWELLVINEERATFKRQVPPPA